MKRILIFSLAYYPHVGGAEVAIKEITNRVAPDDIEFHMVTWRFSVKDPLVEKIGNVTVYRVAGPKIFFPVFSALKAYRLHIKNKYDAWWAMMSYMGIPVTFLRIRGVRLPYVLTLQEGDTYKHMFGRLRVLPLLPFINSGFRNASVVQVISTYLGGWAHKRGFTGPLEVIPNGVDTKKFAGAPTGHESTVLITTSRLAYKNAVDDIIRALPQIPQARLRILGVGQDERALKKLAGELDVLNRTEFLGHIDHADLPAALHAADIFIRPSRSEGMGNSFIEAFAAGVPVIATQEGGIADFLFDAKRNPDKPTTGWAVDVDSPEQIALQVKAILGNPEDTKKVIENARKLAQEKYDWDLIAKQMKEKVFNFLLKTQVQ